MKATVNKFISLTFLSLILMPFQNCSGKFETQNADLSRVVPFDELDEGPTVPAPTPEGKALYAQHCASCHGDLTNSNKKGASPHQINLAISSLSFMASLKSLNGTEVNLISSALGYDPNATKICKGTRTADTNAIFRMTKAEYTNTMADLFGLPASLVQNFPEDNDGEMFANAAQALAYVSADLYEQYLYAAEKAVEQIWASNKASIMICSPEQTAPATCAASIVDQWGLRIFRRPLESQERTQLLAMIKTTAGVSATEFESGVQVALTAMLASPNFYFRTVASQTGVVSSLNGYELASRLSYFLWSSTPDVELLNAAQNGALSTTDGMRAQIQRMLAHSKAKRLTQSFALRWLDMKKLHQRQPDTAVYPQFNASLRSSMEKETSTFFDNLVAKNLSLRDLLVADYTFVNQELAQFYGLSGVTGTQFREVSLAATPRRGIASHASILMSTSHPDDSSIVARGKWVMNTLMCDPPPPPPANIPVDPDIENNPNLSKRQKLEAHRGKAACYSCHAKMDPIGFGLENFNGIGGYRTTLGGKPVDNMGALPDGTGFTSVTELVNYLDSSQAFSQCVTKYLMSYAVGRTLGDAEDCNVKTAAERGLSGNQTLAQTIEAIVNSDLFMKVKGK